MLSVVETAAHVKPVLCELSAFRKCPSVPAAKRAGVLSAVAVTISPFASANDFGIAASATSLVAFTLAGVAALVVEVLVVESSN